jgi:hypothetical protein
MTSKTKAEEKRLKILIPTNFSGHGVTAAEYAIELFKDTAGEFILENVYQGPKGNTGTLISINDIISRDVNEGLKKEWEFLKSKYKNVSIDFQFEEGNPISTIKTAVKRNHFDLLVMGHNAHFKRFHKAFIEQPEYWPVMLVPQEPFLEKAKDAIIVSTEEIDGSIITPDFKNLNKRFKGKSHHLIFKAKDVLENLKAEISAWQKKYKIGMVVFNISRGCRLETAIREHKLDDFFLSLPPTLLISY